MKTRMTKDLGVNLRGSGTPLKISTRGWSDTICSSKGLCSDALWKKWSRFICRRRAKEFKAGRAGAWTKVRAVGLERSAQIQELVRSKGHGLGA